MSKLEDYQTLVQKENDFSDSKFTFLNLLNKRGKQGLVGLCKLQRKNESESENETENESEIALFKFSQYLDFNARHEYLIMKGLNTIRRYCPHFSYCLGIFTDKVSPEFRKTSNPFNYGKSYPVNTDILVTEYIKDARKFCRFIENKSVSERIIYSLIKQVLLAIMIAQKKQNFTHYDLHSNNILIQKCDTETVFQYIIDGVTYTVPTYGFYPVIIDFGFSHSSNLEEKSLYSPLAHTDIGFIPSYFDKFTDCKLFLVTVSDEFKNARRTEESKRFRKCIRRLYSPLDIDFSSGWDETNELSASDSITKLLVQKGKNTSELFFEYNHYCIDLLQTLVDLPLKSGPAYDKITTIETYDMFVNEFKKIENQIGSSFYNIYVFREIIDTVTQIKEQYINRETRENALKLFRHSIYEIVESVTKYCKLKDINYEKLLCGLLAFSSQLQTLLYTMIKAKTKAKEKEYSKLSVKSVKDVYDLIDSKFETPLIQEGKKYGKKRIIYTWNVDEEKNSKEVKKLIHFEANS
jgi:hypothetical protein